MEENRDKNRPVRKIRIGRLAIDPVFLAVFLFFLFSSLSLLLFVLLSLR